MIIIELDFLVMSNKGPLLRGTCYLQRNYMELGFIAS